jgi:uncharacterized membrane protein YdjX (TVP38/TMEM64 family)
MKKKMAIALAGIAVATLLIGARACGFSVQQGGMALLGWIRSAGLGGILLFIAVYVLSSLFLVPCLMWNLAAGFVWGLPLGALIVLPANLAAALTTFLFGRWVARDWVARRMSRYRRLSALDAALERAGLKIVLLMRVSPISPFAMLNYALGVTRMRMRDFVIASLFGTLPGTLIYIALGSALNRASQVFGGVRPSWQHQLLIFGMIPLAGAMALLVRTARQELNRLMQ